MTDQAFAAIMQFLGTMSGAMVGGGAVILSQYKVASSQHAAKMKELSFQAETRRNRIQQNALIRSQKLSNDLVGSFLQSFSMRLQFSKGRATG